MSASPVELEVLRDISARLERARIAYMLTGSVALNFYAIPRMTRDIDIVFEVPPLSPGAIAGLFEPEYYASTEGIADALRHATLFNVIHQATVTKVDLIIRKQTAYGAEAFERRVRMKVDGFETWISTKEDLILAKLSWFADSASERQLNDIRTLLATGFDAAYVAHWVDELGLARFWQSAAAGGHDARDA